MIDLVRIATVGPDQRADNTYTMLLVATAGILSFSIGLSLLIARAALDAVFKLAAWATPSLTYRSQEPPANH